MDPVLTIRNKIINALLGVGDTMPDEDGSRLWNKVMIGPPLIGEQEIPSLSLDPGDDKPEAQIRWKTDKRFIMSVTFKFRRDESGRIDNYQRFEYYYGRLIKAFLADDTIGGAIQIREAGGGPEIEGRDDPRPGGYLLLEVLYRHGRLDPTRKVDSDA